MVDTRLIPEYDLYSNVLAFYSTADADSVERGMTWYDEAHQFARVLGGSEFHRAAGVIAALSPLSPWANNKNKAQKLYDNNGIVVFGPDNSNGYGLSRNVRKAVRIFHGEDALDVLTANKTRSFFLTIADPTGDHSPVIDRHAFDIAIGMRTDDDARKALTWKGEYARFASAYRQAARDAGIAPAQLQAITWVQWRKDIGKDWAG